MSQNQEIIEARLCAYIDDELDAAGRAELEKHLAANPQHQRLIEELRRTSALVRNLPHESAPPELAEAFGAQLERSVLLEGVSEDVAAADLKAPRWPQLVAMAAITLLTVGLAVVVYFALPGTGGRPQIVQTVPHAMTSGISPPDDDRLADARTRDFDKTPNADPEKLSIKKDDNAAAATPDAAAAAGSPLAFAGKAAAPDRLKARGAATEPTEIPAAPASSADGSERQTAAASGALPGNSTPIVLVMHADDPAQARRSLVVYLVQQNIAWEPAQPEAASVALARRGADDAARDVAGAIEPQPAAPTTEPAPKQLQSEEKRDQLPAHAAAATAAPTTAPSGEVVKDALEQAKSAAPEAAPASQPLLDEAKLTGALRRDVSVDGGESAASAKPDFAISCRLTAAQAEELRANLAQPGTSIDALPPDAKQRAIADGNAPRAALPEPAAVTAPPTTTPSDADLARPIPSAAPDSNRTASSGGPSTQPNAALGAGHIEPTTQPWAGEDATLDLMIVVRPADHPATNPSIPVAAGASATQPAVPDVPPAAPATQPQ